MDVTNLDFKVALLAVLVGLPAWPAGEPPGGEVDAGRSRTGRSFWEGSSFCRQDRLIHLARGPPNSRSRVEAMWNQAQQALLQRSWGADSGRPAPISGGQGTDPRLGQRFEAHPKLLKKSFPITTKT